MSGATIRTPEDDAVATKLCQLLLDAKADVRATTSKPGGHSAMALAERFGNVSTARFLKHSRTRQHNA